MSASNSIRWTQPQLMESKTSVPVVGRRAVQTSPFNREYQRDSVDCKGGRGVSCLWTRTISTAIFGENFVGEGSVKVRPAYNRTLETIHEEETETISQKNDDETFEKNMEGKIIAKKVLY